MDPFLKFHVFEEIFKSLNLQILFLHSHIRSGFSPITEYLPFWLPFSTDSNKNV